MVGSSLGDGGDCVTCFPSTRTIIHIHSALISYYSIAERVQLRMRPIGPSTPFSGISLVRLANFNPACKKRIPIDDGRRPGSMCMESGALQQPLNTKWRYGDQALRTERSSAVERLFQQPHGGRRGELASAGLERSVQVNGTESHW